MLCSVALLQGEGSDLSHMVTRGNEVVSRDMGRLSDGLVVAKKVESKIY